jgi:glycerol-3-phosphate acyltransferase PlsY
MITSLLLAVGLGYLLGALPFGYLVARAKGVNIFEVGSKNPGATNVRRVLGAGPGNLVFFLDASKGALATALPLLQLAATDANRTPAAVAGLVGGLLGHSFSCFTGFRGGKGVATATGGLLVLMPWAALIGGAVWAAVFYSSRYVSLASMLAALTMPLSSFLLGQPGLLTGLAAVIALFVVIRHRSNITRLLNGTESRFARKTPPVSSS